MITLDYRTDNPRWGTSGLKYSTWGDFAFALGYLANEIHYRNKYSNGLIELHFESNHLQGAWGKEGRIHYYGTEPYLKSTFNDWYIAKSAGTGNITCRVNSNDYMYSLVHDFRFEERRYIEYTTADIFPPVDNAFNSTWSVLKNYLAQAGYSDKKINDVYGYYVSGWEER